MIVWSILSMQINSERLLLLQEQFEMDFLVLFKNVPVTLGHYCNCYESKLASAKLQPIIATSLASWG